MTGVMTTLLGPILPVLSLRWSLTDNQAGVFFSAQFGASMLGVALSSILVSRHGFQPALVAGFALMALGASILSSHNWLAGVIAVCCYGVGLGITIPATNLLVAGLNTNRRAASLNLVNFSWGIGAVPCPFLVAVIQGAHGNYAFPFGLSAVLLIFSVSLGSISFPNTGSGPLQSNQPRLFLKAWKGRFAPILGALFFLYVGTENAIGGWIAAYARRITKDPGTFWLLTPSFFSCS